MDPAQAIMLNAERYNKPMNEVIDRGDSPVQQYYNGATVFVTGGSGFLGKQLVEKLFRSCAVKKVYLLMRPRKGKTVQERLQYILSDAVFDLLREKQPLFADRLVPVEGDITSVKLGLSDEDWSKLTQEVTVIYHVAAVVKFEEPIRIATQINVVGTREALNFARTCLNLKSFVYVSTAFTSATKDLAGKDVYERFYPCPVPPDTLISLVEEVDEDRLNSITENFIQGWPNTYTFTKSVAEELIRTTAKDLPICIVRPPVVISSYHEPAPGWLDKNAIAGAGGIILAITLGVLHVFRVDKHVPISMAPVDYVNNAIIAAGWDAEERRKTGDTEIPIYTVSNKDCRISWDFIGQNLRRYKNLTTDKAVFHCGLVEVKNNGFLIWLLSWLFHYIPAYIMDAYCAVTGKSFMGIKSFVEVYMKIEKMASIYNYFLSYEWRFNDDNIKSMLNRMSEADRVIYNCDVSTIDRAELVLLWPLGIRKYIIKDGLNKTHIAAKKQKIFGIVNYVVLIVYAYLLWSILYFSFSIVKYLFNIMVY